MSVNGLVELDVCTGTTIRPTLMVRDTEWTKAVAALKAGQTPELSGVTGGHGCRAEALPKGQATVKLVATDEKSDDQYQAEILSGDIPLVGPGTMVFLLERNG